METKALAILIYQAGLSYRKTRRILKKCENKPLILVDRGPWYRFALKRLGLEYRHQRFGERNAIEQWYSLLKSRLKNFWKRFPYHSSL